LLDNFCWGDPRRLETMGSLVEAARGCHDAAVYYRTPFISGKDSLNNEYLGSDGQRHAIPPTLLISAIGIIEDVRQAVTMDLKEAGNVIYLVGDHKPVSLHHGQVPDLPAQALEAYQALHHAMQDNLVRACHDLSEGGLAIAAAEMCIGGRLGLTLGIQANDPERILFDETNGCLLVEVRPEACLPFEAVMTDLPIKRIGSVSAEQRLNISIPEQTNLLSLSVSELVAAWETYLS
ncbi:MAG TPA: AIR synthase-related protein, partial [Anaerolineales bacterium]